MTGNERSNLFGQVANRVLATKHDSEYLRKFIIGAGLVLVNGVFVTEPGLQIYAGDKIELIGSTCIHDPTSWIA